MTCYFQSLAMYVPPDEPIQELGEVNMSFNQDGDSPPHVTGVQGQGNVSMQPNGDPAPVSAVNPIYQRYPHHTYQNLAAIHLARHSHSRRHNTQYTHTVPLHPTT